MSSESGARSSDHGSVQMADVLGPHLDRLLKARQHPKTICPSEVARALSQDELDAMGLEGWRDAMEPIRELVWQRRDVGAVEVLQKGEVLDLETRLEDVRGPIRVRLARSG